MMPPAATPTAAPPIGPLAGAIGGAAVGVAAGLHFRTRIQHGSHLGGLMSSGVARHKAHFVSAEAFLEKAPLCDFSFARSSKERSYCSGHTTRRYRMNSANVRFGAPAHLFPRFGPR